MLCQICFVFFTVVMTLFPKSAAATEVPGGIQRADLLGVYQAALLSDPQLSASRHAFKGQVEAVPQARAGLLPTVSAGTKTEVTHLDRNRPSLTRARSGNTFQANLNQPLFHADRWYQLKAAQSSADQAELELTAKEQTLILTSAQAYFETLRMLDSLAAAKAEEAALSRQRDQAQGRLDDGASSITDVYDAQAAYDNARANRQLAQRKVDDAFEALSRLTNATYSSIVGMGHQLPTGPPVPTNPNVWVEKAVQQNLELLATAKAVNAAQQTVSQRKAGYAPTVDVVATYRKGDNDSFGYSNPTDFGTNGYGGNISQSTISIELNVPLYSGGMTRSQVRESTERLYQRQDEQEDKRREIVLTTRNAFRGITASVEQIFARRQSIFSGMKSVEANQVGMDVGSRNISDVLNAQRQLYAAVRDYNDARYDYIVDTLKLKQATGSLAPSDLQALAVYMKPDYDPDRDFLPPGSLHLSDNTANTPR